MSKSMTTQQKMIKTPPLLVISKIRNYQTSSTHMTVCQCNWPISPTPPHWPPGRAEKNGHHIWPNYDIKNFFQKKVKCTPGPKYWIVTSTLMTFEHSCKQQNVGYTDAMIGCSLTLSYYNLILFYIANSIHSGLVMLVPLICASPLKNLLKQPIFLWHLASNEFSGVCLLPPITTSA